MKNRIIKNIIYHQSLAGAVSGILIVAILLVYDMVLRNLTLSEIIHLHQHSIAYILLDLSPFVFAFVGHIYSKLYVYKLIDLEKIIQTQKIKEENVRAFVEKLTLGDNNAKFRVSSEKDQLGKTLNQLKESIVNNQLDYNKRQQEEMQRTWVNEGLANFGEILRQETNNIEALANNVIINLVKYLNANQGGFFVINDDDEHDVYFVMSACYAYERKKHSDKRIDKGEGLIGTCALEKESIYLEDVPPTYVNITSGLGKATPTCVLLVPIKINEQVYGVIELALFKKLEPYQINFVEKVAESIASTISSVKINDKTARLLDESREQAETLALNEEQMRQNMEELQTAQEEVALQSEKFITFTNTVNHTLIRAEYSPDGNMLYANTKFLQKLGYTSNSEVEGKNISMFINEKDREWFFKIWESLASGGRHFEGHMKHMTKQGKDLWTMATYTSMRRSDGTSEKILFLGLDITEQKQQSLDYEGQISALNRSSIKAEFTIEGEFLDCNKLFLDTFDYESLSDLDEKKVFDIIERIDLTDFTKKWDRIIKGDSFKGVMRGVTKDNKTKWFNCSLTAVNDMYGDIAKVIYIAQDITNEKLMEIECRKQNEQLLAHEEKLKESELNLSKKLERAKAEMQQQFKEIEKSKLRHEKTLEGMLDAILTMNEDGRIDFFNRAAEDLWNYSKEDVIGHNISMLFPPTPEEPFSISLLTPGKPKMIGQRQEIKIITKTGEECQVLVMLSDALVDNEHTYTAFIQKIEVELF